MALTNKTTKRVKDMTLEDIEGLDVNMKISIPASRDAIDILIKEGFEKKSGSCAYVRSFITIYPFKKWFYEDTINWSQ